MDRTNLTKVVVGWCGNMTDPKAEHFPVAEFTMDDSGSLRIKYMDTSSVSRIGKEILDRVGNGEAGVKNLEDVKKYFCSPYSSLAVIELG